MHTATPKSLEEFADRHRAEFDAHEPRPALWAALEKQLDAPLADTLAPIQLAATAVPADVPHRTWLQRYGVAATLAALAFAVGIGRHPSPNAALDAERAGVRSYHSGSERTTNPETAASGSTAAMLAGAHQGGAADSQLHAAVRSMELYYTMQLTQRRAELEQLSGPQTVGMTYDWQNELAALDSSYRHMKLELGFHPQPAAVVAAMNRNLQMRLDILDQQLRLGQLEAPVVKHDGYVLTNGQ